MKNFDKKIFESYMNDEAFNRIKEELSKNPNFQINDDNITDFIDCKLVIDILKEHKIEYKIVAKDMWTSRGKVPQYDLIVSIYIPQKDYVLIKYLFESDNEVEDQEYDDYDIKNDNITKKINLTYNIFINFICFTIGISILSLGILFIKDDITSAIIFIVIGGGLIIFRIAKISKLIINKLTNKRDM